MSLWIRWRLGAAVVGCLLASCGGGGGGGDEPAVSVSANRSSFEFVGFTASPPTPQAIQFTLTGGSGTYYGAIVPDVPSAFTASFTPTSDTTANVTIAPVGATVGSRSGSITFKLCSDPACNKVAWSRNLPYTITVFDVDATAITVSGFEGAVAPARHLTITPADTAQLLNVGASVSTGNGWLEATRSSASQIDVNASGVGQLAGSYQGQVTIGFAGRPEAGALQIPVAFTVGTGTIVPAVTPVDVTVDATSTSLARSVAIAFQGTQTPTWTASSDRPWLVLGAAGGTGPGDLPFTVDPAQLESIANWGSATARISIQAAGMSEASFDVTVNKRWPEVHWVSAGTVVAGRASTVRVFGRGFSQLPGAERILVAGVPGVGTIVSDGEAVLDLPPLPVGRMAVAVRNAAGVATRSAAVGAAWLMNGVPGSVVPNDGEKRSALFDPSRMAVYAVNWTQNALVRFRVVNGTWVVDALPVASIGDLAMGPDRDTLYVGSGTSTLLAVNPDTLTVQATYTVPPTISGSISPSRYVTTGMAMTRDMRLWFGGSQWAGANYFDLLGGTFHTEPSTNGSLYSGVFFASGDGSRMVVSQNGITPAPPTLMYSVGSRSFGQTPPLPFIYATAHWSEDGSRVLLDDTVVHDGNTGALIGSVQIAGAINLGSVLSPDGRRVYTLVTANDNSLLVDHIDVYDTTQLEPGTTRLVKLGEIAVSTQALSCGSSAPYGCSVRGVFFISPLGDTLFWAGNQRLIVLPVSDALSGPLSSRRLMPAAKR